MADTSDGVFCNGRSIWPDPLGGDIFIVPESPVHGKDQT